MPRRSRADKQSALPGPKARKRTCRANASRNRGHTLHKGERWSRYRNVCGKRGRAPLTARADSDGCKFHRCTPAARCRLRWSSAAGRSYRSMMLRRRIPIPTGPSKYVPSSSGPRCSMTWHIARNCSRSGRAPRSNSRIPAIPHIQLILREIMIESERPTAGSRDPFATSVLETGSPWSRSNPPAFATPATPGACRYPESFRRDR